MSAPRVIVVVLGMHRGGTSALAGLLRVLGVEFGTDLLPGQPENPLGFFEHRALVSANDAILRAAGAAWDEPLPERGAPFWRRVSAKPLAEAARRLREELGAGTAAPWGLKDPRMARLLTPWRETFAQMGARPAFALIVRHPAEVAASLRARGNDARNARLLWLEHLLAAERDTRRSARVIVTYDALLVDWRAVAQRLADAFGLRWPRDPADPAVAGEADAFLRPTLRHHHAKAPGGGGDDGVAGEVYGLLRRLSDGADLDAPEVLAALDAHRRIIADLTWQHTAGVARLGAQRLRAQGIMDAQATELEGLRAVVAALRLDRAVAQGVMDAQAVELRAARDSAAAALTERREAQRVMDAQAAEVNSLRGELAALRADRDDAQVIMEQLSAELACRPTPALPPLGAA